MRFRTRQRRAGVQLAFERLEGRQLMANDLISPLHNFMEPEDTNDDGICSVADALIIVSELRVGPGSQEGFVDADDNGICTPADILPVIERLKREIGLPPDDGSDDIPGPSTVDVILEWNDILLQANAADHARARPEQGGPILTGRAFALVSAAMYDAFNAIESIGEAFMVQTPGARADLDAAVAQAAYETLSALFPSQQALFDQALANTLSRIANGTRENRGVAIGAHVAERILALRADDGATKINDSIYTANHLPGFHDVDPLNPSQPFYGVGAMNMATFALENVDQFQARRLDDGTPAGRLAFLQSAEYTDAYNELVALGGDGENSPTQRTQEQTHIGIYWAYDGRPGLGTPPRLYNQIARTIADQQGNTEAENARMFALLNLAMSDAGLVSWNNKYDDAFWRPVMGLRGGDLDGNPDTVGDPDWTPLGAPASNPREGETNFTPPFPAYTSGHATFGAAAFQILARFYGTDDLGFTFISDELNGVTLDANGQARPLVPRSFDNLTQAKLENAQSRIYLGIHWAFDASDGIRTGDMVADYLYENVLRPNGS